ncbi:MAG: 50S ribosomal protein L10 [Rickettsia sp.]|nr:50S ribosomal protein L10 [Rickettsia sp.]
MLKQEKSKLIDELSEIYLNKKIIFFVKYSHLSVHFVEELRVELRECGACLKIVKNRLSKISFQKNSIHYDESFFVGPNAIAYSDDPIETVKILLKFSKKNEKLCLFAGLFEKSILQYEDLVQLSKVPSLDVLRFNIIQSLLFPGRRILKNLQDSSSKIIYLLNNLSSKKKE